MREFNEQFLSYLIFKNCLFLRFPQKKNTPRQHNNIKEQYRIKLTSTMTTFATSKINFLFVIGLATFTYRTYGQDIDSRFIVFLGHFVQPFLNETVIQCAGTLISVQHILCTASCVVVESPTQIAVEVSTTTLVPEGGYFTGEWKTENGGKI